MNIPERLKIGGKTYDVELTDKLYLGAANYNGEILYQDLVIRIAPGAKQKMETTFIHEMMHGILDFLGYTDHDEKKVDELANALHMVITDNPDVFTTKGEHNA